MNAKAPPVPAENRSPKGAGSDPRIDAASDVRSPGGAGNVDKQGQQGNSHVNTTHQGYQQDR